MTAATLFSGIGAPEVAMPHWRWIWHAEIETFPAAVMRERHPTSVNLGDVTTDDFLERAIAIGRPDVLVFGSPCQSFSVAGRRLGLDDPRGNLALIALGIVARLEPTWIVFENVPGLLSAAEGRDFGLFLRTVDELRYHLCWTHLDARYAGLAQRRLRLFAVGHAQDWRYPAAVLLEPESLCGHPPTRGEAREDIAGTLDVGTSAGGHGRFASADGAARNHLIAPDVANTLTHRMHKGINTTCDEGQTMIAHALRADGFDASEDGTGRGTPLVPVVASTLKNNHGGGGFGSDPSETFIPIQQNGTNLGVDLPSLRRGDGGFTSGVPAVFDPNQITSKENRCQPTPGVSHPLPAQGNAPIAFHSRQDPDSGDVTHPLDTDGHSVGVMTVALRGREGGGTAELGGSVATALRASQGGGDKPHVLASGVRRLLPVECERLMGLPDGYTAITYRGKPAKDGPRYKAIGNSMAVPVIRWILERIERVESLVPDPRAEGV